VLFDENTRVSSLARALDGSRLAFVVHDKSAARLVTMPAGGGEVSSVLMSAGYFGATNERRPLIWAVAWMPDGQRLLVVRYDDEVAGSTDWAQRPLWLWDVPLDGRAPRKVGVLPLPKVQGNYFAGIGGFTIHPDGKRLAFHSHEGYLEQTWAIDNLVSLIKASAAP
jgi:WD40 repeat protein